MAWVSAKKISPVGAAVVCVVLFITWIGLLMAQRSYDTVIVSVRGESFVARVADTDAKRSRGLSGTGTLAPDEAMLFVFPEPSRTAFWMKGMNYPIDIVWMRDGLVRDIASRVPPTLETDESKIPRYYPRDNADHVLEFAAGTVDRLHIAIGDRVTITESR